MIVLNYLIFILFVAGTMALYQEEQPELFCKILGVGMVHFWSEQVKATMENLLFLLCKFLKEN